MRHRIFKWIEASLQLAEAKRTCPPMSCGGNPIFGGLQGASAVSVHS